MQDLSCIKINIFFSQKNTKDFSSSAATADMKAMPEFMFSYRYIHTYRMNTYTYTITII